MTFGPPITDRPPAGILGVTTLSIIKPWLRAVLREPVQKLFEAGIVANQVTMVSIAGSLLTGGILVVGQHRPLLFLLLPVWLAGRTALASIDGALAIDSGQKSRLGGYLNEVGDIVCEFALWAPLCVVAPMATPWVVFILVLAMVAELAGMMGPLLGGARRIDGPLGKADRSLVLGGIGVCIATTGTIPDVMSAYGMPLIATLLIITIINRVRLARRDARNISAGKAAQ